MISPQYILLFCWIVFIGYWFISSFSLKPTLETKWNLGKIRWYVFGVVLIIIFIKQTFFNSVFHLSSCSFNWVSCHLEISPYPNVFLQNIGVISTILGLCIALIARYTIGKNWSGSIDIKKDHELITKGIYGYVRHPIYTGAFFMALGAALVFQQMFIWILLAVVVVFFIIKYKQEEKFMTKYFPKEYPAYKKRVKAILPFIF